jgi:hypothetical protein
MRTMIAAVGMVVVMMNAGCIIQDFEDGGGEFINGCSHNAAMSSAQVIIRAGNGECKTVAAGTTVSFEVGATDFKCTLRGGRSTGDVAEPDSTSIIEMAEPKTKALHQGKVSILFDVLRPHPYYCEEDPAAAGVIFVK